MNSIDFNFTDSIDEHSSNGAWDISLTKINVDGSYGWTKTIGNTGDEVSHSIVIDKSNNIFITGSFEEVVNFDFSDNSDEHSSNGSADIFLTKISSEGKYIWTKTFGGEKKEDSKALILDDDNLYILGSFENMVDFNFNELYDNHTSIGYADIFLTKISINR